MVKYPLRNGLVEAATPVEVGHNRGHFGMVDGVAYTEAFPSMHPQAYDRPPLTLHTRVKASEPNAEWHARVCRLLAAQVPVSPRR